MLGFHIDHALNDEQRDRLIRHPGEWTPFTMSTSDGGGCYVGVILGWPTGGRGVGRDHPEFEELSQRTKRLGRILPGRWPRYRRRLEQPYERFNRLCVRFGPDRIGRAIKLRAARGNRVDLPASLTHATR